MHSRLLALTLKTDCIAGGARVIEARLTDEENLTRQAGEVVIEIPACVRRSGKTWIATPSGRTSRQRPINNVLVRALKVAHAALKDAGLSPHARMEALADGAAPPNAHERKLSLLAFLAPDIQSAILDGRQPPKPDSESSLRARICPLAWTRAARRAPELIARWGAAAFLALA